MRGPFATSIFFERLNTIKNNTKDVSKDVLSILYNKVSIYITASIISMIVGNIIINKIYEYLNY